MEEDMYVLSGDGTVLSEPLAKPWPNKPPKCSDCGPLFLKVMFEQISLWFIEFCVRSCFGETGICLRAIISILTSILSRFFGY